MRNGSEAQAFGFNAEYNSLYIYFWGGIKRQKYAKLEKKGRHETHFTRRIIIQK